MQESIGKIEKALKNSDVLFEIKGYGPDSPIRSQIADAKEEVKKLNLTESFKTDTLPTFCIDCQMDLPPDNCTGICRQCLITHDF